MKQWYFEYNGRTYPSGVVIIIDGKEAVFVWYETDSRRYAYKTKDKLNGENIVPESIFRRTLNQVIEDKIEAKYVQSEIDAWKQRNKKPTFKEELDIDGMLTAWIWYVSIMGVAIIFNERILIWMAASMVFFAYRKQKINERRNGK